MDEVLCNLISPLAEKFGVDFQQITNYHLWEIMNISKQEAIEAAIDMIKEDFEKNHTILTPTEYSSDVVAHLKSRATKMFVITSRPSLVEKNTLSWLNRYFPQKFDEVIFTNKTMDVGL
jgi:phosphoglycolate phosphatase-like HAD superfamily hydrolase